MSFRIIFTKQAEKDYAKILASNLKAKVFSIISLLKENPLQPPLEKLSGNLCGLYSKRINIQHRLVYRVDVDEKTVIIARMWTHYGDN